MIISCYGTPMRKFFSSVLPFSLVYDNFILKALYLLDHFPTLLQSKELKARKQENSILLSDCLVSKSSSPSLLYKTQKLILGVPKIRTQH